MVLGAGNQPVALATGVTEAWPCTTRRTPDRAPCHGFDPFAGRNPDNCGVGSNGTILWCPLDYCYTLLQPFAPAPGEHAQAGGKP